MLLSKYFFILELRPHESAIFSVLIDNGPPKSPFHKSFNHIGVITHRNISFLFGIERSGLFQIQLNVDIMGDHYFPKKLNETVYAFLIDGIEFLVTVGFY